MVAAVAMSSAFTLEVQLAKAQIVAPLTYSVFAADGSSLAINLAEQEFPDMTWVAESFSKAIVSGQINLLPPYPIIRVAGKPSNYQTGMHGEVFRDEGYIGQKYRLDCDVFTSRDRPEYAQREALILSRALESLIRRNEHLGGLVQLIQPTAPIEPGGTGSVGKSAVVAGARQTYEVLVLSS